MIRCYDRSIVQGVNDQGRHYQEEVLHLRNQDPMLMAIRRNPGLAQCNTIMVQTFEIARYFMDDEIHIGRNDIPHYPGRAELDW